MSDLLTSKAVALDREESVDVSSGRVIVQVPSLADLMDYDIEEDDLRPETAGMGLGHSELLSPSRLNGDGGGVMEDSRPSPVVTVPDVSSDMIARVSMHTGNGNSPVTVTPTPPPTHSTQPSHSPPNTAVKSSSSLRQRKISLVRSDDVTAVTGGAPSLIGHKVLPTPIAVTNATHTIPTTHTDMSALLFDTQARPVSPVPWGQHGQSQPPQRPNDHNEPTSHWPTTAPGHHRHGSNISATSSVVSHGPSTSRKQSFVFDEPVGVDEVELQTHGHGHASRHATATTVTPPVDDVVELCGRGVLMRQGSRPKTLYGNMPLVEDVPVTFGANMLTFTQSKASLVMSRSPPPTLHSHGNVEQKLWEVLYGDGSLPSTSVVVDVDEVTGTPDVNTTQHSTPGPQDSSLWSLGSDVGEDRLIPSPLNNRTKLK